MVLVPGGAAGKFTQTGPGTYCYAEARGSSEFLRGVDARFVYRVKNVDASSGEVFLMKLLWVKAGGRLPPDMGGKIRSYSIF